MMNTGPMIGFTIKMSAIRSNNFIMSIKAHPVKFFIPIRISEGLNRRLPAQLVDISSVQPLWVAQRGGYAEDLGNLTPGKSNFFRFLHH